MTVKCKSLGTISRIQELECDVFVLNRIEICNICFVSKTTNIGQMIVPDNSFKGILNVLISVIYK